MMALHPWRTHTDTSEHYKVYQVLLGYNTGVYDIAEAKAKLQNVDLSDRNTYVKEIKEVIEKIMAYEDKPVKVEKPVENETIKVKSTSKKGRKTKKRTNKTVETDTVDG
jgi:hypothetical protein